MDLEKHALSIATFDTGTALGLSIQFDTPQEMSVSRQMAKSYSDYYYPDVQTFSQEDLRMVDGGRDLLAPQLLVAATDRMYRPALRNEKNVPFFLSDAERHFHQLLHAACIRSIKGTGIPQDGHRKDRKIEGSDSPDEQSSRLIGGFLNEIDKIELPGSVRQALESYELQRVYLSGLTPQQRNAAHEAPAFGKDNTEAVAKILDATQTLYRSLLEGIQLSPTFQHPTHHLTNAVQWKVRMFQRVKVSSGEADQAFAGRQTIEAFLSEVDRAGRPASFVQAFGKGAAWLAEQARQLWIKSFGDSRNKA